MNQIKILIKGKRPPYYEISDHLWPGVSIDSDGDSETPESTDWTELTIINRENEYLRVDIDPISQSPLILKIESEIEELALKTANYLLGSCKSEVLK